MDLLAARDGARFATAGTDGGPKRLYSCSGPQVWASSLWGRRRELATSQQRGDLTVFRRTDAAARIRVRLCRSMALGAQ